MDRSVRPIAANSLFGKCTQADCHIFQATPLRAACAEALGPKRWQVRIGTLVTRRQSRARKRLCAEVIGNDFDLIGNKFSYTPLKEPGTKVSKFLCNKTKSRHTVTGDAYCEIRVLVAA